MTVVTETPLASRIAGKPRVIVTRRLLPETEARMAELFDVALNPDDRPMSREAIVAAMHDCDVLVPTVTDRIDRAVLSHSGEKLRLIANFGNGVDNIDVATALQRGITVTNTPGVLTEDTADMTMALILSVPRRLAEGEKLMRSGKWAGWAPSAMLGHRVGGKLLGIIGMGRIGLAVAHRARAFGLSIHYHNRRRLPEAIEEELGAIGGQRGAEAVEHRQWQAAGIAWLLHHHRRHRADQHRLGHPSRLGAGDIGRHFAAAGGMADMDRALEVERGGQRDHVGGIMRHVMAAR